LSAEDEDVAGLWGMPLVVEGGLGEIGNGGVEESNEGAGEGEWSGSLHAPPGGTEESDVHGEKRLTLPTRWRQGFWVPENKRKPGRPKKDPAARRGMRVSVRLTAYEAASIGLSAQKAGFGLAEWARRRLLE